MNYQNRISPIFISTLASNEVYVFESNEAGSFNVGSGARALKFGAKKGKGNGLSGQTYGIPVKGKSSQISLPLKRINSYIEIFIDYAKQNPEKIFLVEHLGKGIYKEESIASLFVNALEVENIYLPVKYWKTLLGGEKTNE